MTAVVRGIAWLGIFIGICVAPLALALMSTTRPGQGFWTDFSVALGFVGLALMGIEFALVARVKTIAEPFGTDAVIDFHRQIGYVGLLFVLIHVALSADWSQANPFNPSSTPATVLVGAVAAGALVVLVASSIWRSRLRLSYEVWQVVHAVLAAVAVVDVAVVAALDHHVHEAVAALRGRAVRIAGGRARSLVAGLALSILVGVALGLLGGGGSILTLPILVYVLKMDAHAAIATSLLVVGTTSAAALIPHARAGRVRWKTGATFGATSMVGAYAAGRVAHFIPGIVLLLAFGAMMLVTAIAMMRPQKTVDPSVDGAAPRKNFNGLSPCNATRLP